MTEPHRISTRKVCQHCGAHFERRARLSDIQWAGRRYCSKPCASARSAKRDADIVAMYQAQIPSTEIAEVVGVSAVQVLRVLRSCGVKIRTFVEANKVRHNGPKKPVFRCENNDFSVNLTNQRGALNRPADLSTPSQRRA